MTIRTTRIASIGVGAALLAAAFAGCGGSDGDSGALSKEDFIAQADQICADSIAESKTNEDDFVAAIGANDIETAADIIAANGDLISEGVDQVEALEAPEEDQETIDEFISISREQADLLAELADAVRADDGAAVEEISAEGETIQAESDALADEYGMVDCGSAGNEA